MAHRPYFTAPIKTDRMPPGIPYIVGNEAAERFNFYGMRAVLFVFMTKYLRDQAGGSMQENGEPAVSLVCRLKLSSRPSAR